MGSVTAVLPTFGRHDLTLQAIHLLLQQSVPPAEIVVVDDGSPEPFRAGSGVQVIRHHTNRGFAAAVNSGMNAVNTPLTAIVNNDVTLATDWLARLESVIHERSVGFACGKLYRPDGKIDGTFDLLSRGGLAWRVGAGRDDEPLWSEPQYISFTSFTAVLGKTNVFRQGGGLDDSYHSYYEDVAWSLAAALRQQCGYYEPLATGVHLGSATAGTWSPYFARQILRNHRRLALQFLLPRYRRQYLVARALLRFHCLRHGHWPSLPGEAVAKCEQLEGIDQILQLSESKLRHYQLAGGADGLWTWYFRLAGEDS